MKIRNALVDFMIPQVLQAIKIQTNYNEVFNQELDMTIARLQETENPESVLLSALLPNRMVVRNYEITNHLYFQSSSAKGFKIQLNPLSLQYARLFSSEKTQSCKLSVTVKQQAVTENKNRIN